MLQPCSVMTERFFPLLRALVTRRLSTEGYPQTKIASYLGISQAMVSKYLTRSLPPGPREEADYLATEVALLIASGADKATLTGLICQWCFDHKEKGNLCTHHPVDHCSVCITLRNKEAVGERHHVLSDLDAAVRELEGKDLEAITPQVRINIAEALPGAENIMDIASIPGRLVPVGDGIRVLAPPEFGISRHLSTLLLSIMKREPEYRAIMNIRYDPNVEQVLKDSGDRVLVLDRHRYENLPEMIRTMTRIPFKILIDPGDFGIEPCTYLLGQSAPAIVREALRIRDRIVSMDSGTPPAGVGEENDE